VSSEGDTGNHCVPQFTWTPPFVPQRHQITSFLRGGCIKRSDSALNFVDKDLLERLN
jgi:hypothetical protein